jgi:hypothetical protein
MHVRTGDLPFPCKFAFYVTFSMQQQAPHLPTFLQNLKHLNFFGVNIQTIPYLVLMAAHQLSLGSLSPTHAKLGIYWVSVLEVYKNTCCVLVPKIFMKFVFSNSVQSNSKRFLCTSAHFNVGTCCSSTDI